MQRLARSATINVAANAASSAAQWLVVVIFAQAYGSQALGAYGLILAVVSPLFLFGGLNLRVLASSMPERAYDPAALMRLQRLGIALAAGGALGAAVLLQPRDGLSPGLWVAVVALKMVETAAEGRYGFLQRAHQAWPIAVRKFVRAGTTVALLFALARLAGWPPGPAMAGVFAGALAVSLLLDRWPVAKGGLARASRTGTGALLRMALFSGATAAVDALVIAVPRLGLGGASLAAVGTFTVLVQIPMAGAVVVSGIGQAVISRLRAARGRRAFLTLLACAYGAVGLLGLAGTVLASWWGEAFVHLLYGADFAGAGALLPPVMWGGLAWYLAGMSGVGLQARGRYGAQLAATVAAVCAATVAMVLQPPTVQGAVNAYLAAMLARLAVSTAALIWIVAHWEGEAAVPGDCAEFRPEGRGPC
ncbi:Uncharacterised protein [Bordetella ansorpii]|uniref:Polysaccharide biosynthesis protein n=1 Tax=Bordetella ansorpii TaxID=288768 RepID=A0A146AXD9_9BORD|nr:hypothetical protein [Bordetella ansorpii]CZZ93998.1 Uncharacterised protein [Bordetella ansorpii]